MTSNQKKKMSRHHSSPFPACFRPPTTTPAIDYHHAPPPTTSTTTTPNLTTCLYQTHLGLFSITWSRSFLARTLHLHLHPSSSTTPSPSTTATSSPSFHLTLKPFLFWSKHGLKKLPSDNNHHSLHIAWDFTHAKFGSGPEPESGYYIAVISNSTTVLFVGDMDKAFHSAMKRNRSSSNDIASPGGTQFRTHQSMVVRREHVCGNRFYTTKTNLGGKTRLILIELNKAVEDDPRLVIRFDNKRVIQVKHLKWKFRGSERIEVDGHRVQLSWDVYNWLFDDDSAAAAGGGGATHDEGYALFTFRFEAEDGDEKYHSGPAAAAMWRRRSSERVMMWSQDSCGLSYERKKMKKKLLVKTRSSSSSSLSSASSSGSSSSVMEWESVEENELKGPTGFSLLVYAWKN